MLEASERILFRRYAELNTECIAYSGTQKRRLRKFMDIFKNKKIKELESRIEHVAEYFRDRTSSLQEDAEALYLLTCKEYVFIHPDYNHFVDDKSLSPSEARNYYSKLGYIYTAPFKSLGELWIKESKDV